MSLRQTEILRLDWDPTKTQLQDGDTSRFEWAIDHEAQQKPDWCWAACLSNALSGFGVYIDQDEIVEKFKADHGGSPDLSGDDRVPPEYIRCLWCSYGFFKADKRDGPMSFEALVKEITENGPVQIELWPEGDEKRSHLALIFGVRETTDSQMVCVSDPHPHAGRPDWYYYKAMLGPNPLVKSGFGRWQRTYFNLSYGKGYLRRFFQPAEFLVGWDNGAVDAAPLVVQPVISSLQFEKTPLDPFHLSHELAVASYGYRSYRYRDALRKKSEAVDDLLADLKRPLFLCESIPVWKPPSKIDYGGSLSKQLQPSLLWHHQIHDAEGRPRYYAHAYFFEKVRQRFDRAWRTTWIGERWRAEQVDRAIETLDSKFADRADKVRLVWFRRFGFMTLHLRESNLHVVANAHKKQLETFPLLAEFTDDHLRETLAGLQASTGGGNSDVD